MKTIITILSGLFFFITTIVFLPAQNIVGDWTLTSGTYNNSTIQNLSGTLKIFNCTDDTINYNASFAYGNYAGATYARFNLSGNQFLSNLTDAGPTIALNGFSAGYEGGELSWATSLDITSTAFNQVGGTAILYEDPYFSVSGSTMTITSTNGNTILKYASNNNTPYTGFGCGAFVPPDNNSCNNPQEVFLGEDQPFSTLGATSNGPTHPTGGCFSSSANVHHDIWYSFTAPNTATVEFSTCDDVGWNTRLVVYKAGEVCPFTDGDVWACNDNGLGCLNSTSYLTFETQAGSTYILRIGGAQEGLSGEGVFHLTELSVRTEENTLLGETGLAPNPVFNSSTLHLSLQNPAVVSFEVLNVLGQPLQRINPGSLSQGNHEFEFDASTLTKGIYFINILANKQHRILKFVKL